MFNEGDVQSGSPGLIVFHAFSMRALMLSE